MTTVELVYAQAAALAGELEERQQELLKLLCTGAVNVLEGRLREGLTVESCKADFIAAASLYALAALSESEEKVQEFRAGDLTVKQGSGGSAASRCLRRQAEMILAPYLADGFAFLGCDMRKVVEKIMGQYGTDLVLSGSGGEKTVRGFFRAVNAKSWQGMESQATALGEISRGQYVCMVPAAEEVREGDTLGLGGKTYLVRRAEIYFYGNAPIYRWGLCVEKGVNDTWGSRS